MAERTPWKISVCCNDHRGMPDGHAVTIHVEHPDGSIVLELEGPSWLTHENPVCRWVQATDHWKLRLGRRLFRTAGPPRHHVGNIYWDSVWLTEATMRAVVGYAIERGYQVICEEERGTALLPAGASIA